MQDVSSIEERKCESPTLGQILKGLRSHPYNSPHFRHREIESEVHRLEMTFLPKMTKSLKEHLMIKTTANCYLPCFLSPKKF